MTYRNRKLLDVAHEAPHCFLGIKGICVSSEDGYSPCHSNLQRHGRGFAHKSADVYAVPGCHACHRWLDYGKTAREEKEAAFMSAWERYILWLFETGKVIAK